MGAETQLNFAIFAPTECYDESEYYYRPGGLPPVDVGDKFYDERFTIICKLGYGCSSTVWLARDAKMSQYVALKMLSAEQSSLDLQMKIQDFLCQQEKAPLDSHILKILDKFEFASPNGKHTCLVFELAGPSLNSIRGFRKIKPQVARGLSRDIACAIKFLHQSSIAFGDLSTSNILLRLKDLSQDDEDTVIERFGGASDLCDLDSLDGKEAYRKHGPKYQYNSYDPETLDLDLLKPEVVLTDLNEATLVVDRESFDSVTSEESAVHMNIAAPEYIFGINRRHSLGSDIWSLACCFFEIRSCKPLITSSAVDVVGLIGPLPKSWICSIESSTEHKGHQALLAAKQIQENDCQTLKQRIEEIGDWHPWVSMTWEERRHFYIEHIGRDFGKIPAFHERLEDRPPPPAKLSDAEAHDFYDLLSKMLRYDPCERITIDEVLAHPWLNRTYDEPDDYAEWISDYADGNTMCIVDYWHYLNKPQQIPPSQDIETVAEEKGMINRTNNATHPSKAGDEVQDKNQDDCVDDSLSTSDETSSTASDGVFSIDGQEMSCSGLLDTELEESELRKDSGVDQKDALEQQDSDLVSIPNYEE